MTHRLAVLASHPIHYQAPLWRLLAANPNLELKVFFRKDTGLSPYHDEEFGKTIQWNLPLTDGYDHIFLKGMPGLFGHLRRGRYQALLVHAWNSPGAWVAVFFAKVLGMRVLLRAESPWNQEKGRPGLRRVVRRIALKAFFAMVDRFLYIGAENREFYLRYGIPEHKMFFAPYAVDNRRFFSEADTLRARRGKLRSEMGIPEDAVVLLSVGKMIGKKRQMDLLRAYDRVGSPRKALAIVGDGELRPILEEYVAERKLKGVFLPGFKDQAEISPYYAIADVFVLPSGRGETWGLVLNEAMCFGLPVIVSDMVGSAADLARDGENGYLFPLGDLDALAGKMATMIEDQNLRRKFGRRSREIIGGYSYEADVAGILEALA